MPALRNFLFNTKDITVEEINQYTISLGLDTESSVIEWMQLDNIYKTTTTARWKLILKLFKWMSWKKYRPDIYDCDDFADALRFRLKLLTLHNAVGVAIGSIPAGYHAWTVIYATDSLMFIEPQTMKLIDLHGEYKMYKLRM